MKELLFRKRANGFRASALIVLLTCLAGWIPRSAAQEVEGPTLIDPNLTVRTVVDGLDTPITMAFIGEDDILVLEKGTGRVRRVSDGVVQPAAVLDLAVNSASERG